MQCLGFVPNEFAFLIACVVENEHDGHIGIQAPQFIEQLTDTVGIDVSIIRDHDQFMGNGIEGRQDIQALPTSGCLNEDARK